MRELRRKNQEMTCEQTLEVLKNGRTGVMAVAGVDGYPYALPVNYIYLKGRIYIHGAKEGHKIDAIRKEERVSFCVMEDEQILEERFLTHYRSVIVFGKAVIVEDPEEKKTAVSACTAGFAPSVSAQNREKEVMRGLQSVGIIRIDPDHITGKQSRDLVSP